MGHYRGLGDVFDEAPILELVKENVDAVTLLAELDE